MFKDTQVFSGFSIDDPEAARRFYGDVLGIEVEDGEMGGILMLHFGGGGPPTIAYPKPDHVPAEFTILNFPVPDVETAVDALVAKGVVFEVYGGDLPQDEKGIMRGHGPEIAWFKDPAGNILSVIED
ncbi:MAG: VOC family protein [Solirubrobacteraceae bacterium]|nr:VOC family protein [Solirubrobacteraceae bacterium]